MWLWKRVAYWKSVVTEALEKKKGAKEQKKSWVCGEHIHARVVNCPHATMQSPSEKPNTIIDYIAIQKLQHFKILNGTSLYHQPMYTREPPPTVVPTFHVTSHFNILEQRVIDESSLSKHNLYQIATRHVTFSCQGMTWHPG